MCTVHKWQIFLNRLYASQHEKQVECLYLRITDVFALSISHANRNNAKCIEMSVFFLFIWNVSFRLSVEVMDCSVILKDAQMRGDTVGACEEALSKKKVNHGAVIASSHSSFDDSVCVFVCIGTLLKCMIIVHSYRPHIAFQIINILLYRRIHKVRCYCSRMYCALHDRMVKR